MIAERIGSIYETPRLCLPCGKEFTPRRRRYDHLIGVVEYCSDACRKTAHKRQNNHRATTEHRARLPIMDPPVVRIERPARLASTASQPVNPSIRSRRIESATTRAAAPSWCARAIAARIKKGWSRGDLAAALGVAIGSIENWERGKAEPTISKFAAIARVLGVSLDELWGGTS